MVKVGCNSRKRKVQQKTNRLASSGDHDHSATNNSVRRNLNSEFSDNRCRGQFNKHYFCDGKSYHSPIKHHEMNPVSWNKSPADVSAIINAEHLPPNNYKWHSDQYENTTEAARCLFSMSLSNINDEAINAADSLSNSAPDTNNIAYCGKVIGKRRLYCSTMQKYGAWESLYEGRDEHIPLRRGGSIQFFPQVIDERKRSNVVDELTSGKFFKQYSFRGHYHEPRLHALFSEPGTGYRYHDVRMACFSIHTTPHLFSLKKELEKQFNFPSFNIGAHVVCYRDGNDSIGWHADDTQGETLIFSVVLSSHNCTRSVKVRPSKNKASAYNKLQDGDEEIILSVGERDAYLMDGMFYCL